MPGPEGFDPATEELAAQWDADRAQEAAKPLFADDRHYRSEADRQAALANAETSNVARAAGELGF